MAITFQQFEEVDMRAGTIIRAEKFPEARKSAYKLWIDFGEGFGVKQSSAQITQRYSIEELVGMQVIAVVNFVPKKIASFVSEVLTLGVNDESGNVVLLQTQSGVPNGTRIY